MHYRNIAAWQHCHRLALEVYRITRSWPADERYGLTSQVRRAAVSAAANIVEGSSRRGTKEFRRFLDMARGSLNEVVYLLLLAQDLGYLQSEEADRIKPLQEHACALTWRLYNSLRD